MRAHSFGPSWGGSSLHRACRSPLGVPRRITAQVVAVSAGLIGGLGLIAKMIVMMVQGGPQPATSVPENIAFFVGIIGVAVAWVAEGVSLMSRQSLPWRIGGGVIAFLILGLVLGVGQIVLTAMPGDGWWQEELIFPLLGLGTLIAALMIGVGWRSSAE